MDFINAFTSIIESPVSFTLLIAPPAWGKTSLLKEIIFKNKKKIVFISPLKALALEFNEALLRENHGRVKLINSRKESFKKTQEFCELDYGLLIVTPELISDHIFDYIHFFSKEALFVFDEFHLFYSWGQDFRPIMFETLMNAVNREFNILGLSATIPESLCTIIKKDISRNMNSIQIINLGNMKLLYRPYLDLGFKGFFNLSFRRRFFHEIKKIKPGETYLYFCKYRVQVDDLKRKIRRENLSVLGCKGGEVDQFISLLNLKRPPQVIVATSCLSHGVNLPEISKVFIDHDVNDQFFIQMIGRGGRRGEKYSVFHMNRSMTFMSLTLDLYLKLKDYFII